MPLLETVYSVIAGCALVCLYYLNEMYTFNDLDDGSSRLYGHIIAPLLIVLAVVLGFTLYQAIRLRIVIRQIGFNIDFSLLELLRKFTRLLFLFLINWCITGIAIPILTELHPSRTSIASCSFISIFFSNTLLSLGPQCRHFSRWINYYDDEIRKIGTVSKFHGLSYIIFTIKLYSVTSLGSSILVLTELTSKVGEEDFEIWKLVFYVLCSVFSITLWMYCHHFHSVVFAFLSENAGHSVLFGREHSLLSGITVTPKLTNTESESHTPTFWKRYSFYLQNLLLILSSLSTLIGALIFETSSQNASADMTIIWISSIAIIAISGGSMLVHFLYRSAPQRVVILVAVDNKFRICCVLKTWLLMLTVVLIVELQNDDASNSSSNSSAISIWKMVFGVMAILNVLTITMLTARFNNRFWNRLNSLRVNSSQHTTKME